MKPKDAENANPQMELFKVRLDSFLNMKHPLIQLSMKFDWEYFEEEFGKQFNDRGRPGLSTRLMEP